MPTNLRLKSPWDFIFRSYSCFALQAFSKTAIFVRQIKSFLWSLLFLNKNEPFFSKGFPFPSGLKNETLQQDIQHLSEIDAVFKHIVEKYGMPTIPKRPQGFEILALLILEQQVSIDSAKANFLKLKAREVNFQPEFLLAISDEEFRNIGVSRQKNLLHQGVVPFYNPQSY